MTAKNISKFRKMYMISLKSVVAENIKRLKFDEIF